VTLELSAPRRGLLFRAGIESGPGRRRALAAEALRAMRDRRRRFFRGEEAFDAELEDLFLSRKCLANWAAYRVASAEGLGAAEAPGLTRLAVTGAAGAFGGGRTPSRTNRHERARLAAPSERRFTCPSTRRWIL